MTKAIPAAIGIAAIFAIILISGCGTCTTCGTPSTFMSLTPDDANDLIIAEQSNPDFMIIDLRTAAEFASGHIENAVNIDYYAADFQSQLDALNKDGLYLIYCQSGGRSASTMTIMESLGFKEVYQIEGGLDAWILASYPVV